MLPIKLLGMARSRKPDIQITPMDGDALVAAEKQRTRRTAIVAAAACGIAIGGVAFGLNACDKMFNAVVPHKDSQVEAEAALSHIELPAKTIIVEGTGDSAAVVDVRPESNLPLGIGWAFNHTVAKVTGNKTGVKRQGKVQIGVGSLNPKNPAITLSPYKYTPTESQTSTMTNVLKDGDSILGIHADVNMDEMFSQVANMKTVKVSSDPDFFDISTAQDLAEYSTTMSDTADQLFHYSCGNALAADAAPGTEVFVKGYVTSSAGLLARTSGQAEAARVLRQLAKPPVQVSFYRTQTLPNGSKHKVTVTPEQFRLPDATPPSVQSVAKEIHKNPHDVHFDSDRKKCLFTPGALKDQIGILTQNTGEAVKPGV